MYVSQEVMTILATTPGAGMASANLAISLIVKSVQQTLTPPSAPSNQQGSQPSTPLLANSHSVHQVDIRA